ncbi:hypothetical protein [Flavicella marina]|uniref:hypothetical protein n=1 Tax=Flavicella marina TaxID=1475951 RepID=UPI001264DAA3|nr:hypothetical protein [Flavicella marina]
MSLRSQHYPEIPDDLLNLWEGANVVIVDETGKEFDSTAWYFNDVTKPVGKISMRNDFIVVFFCNFEDNGSQTSGFIASFDTLGNLVSTNSCYNEDIEGTGFFRSSIQNKLIILTSTEEDGVTEDIIKVNDNGYFETISFIKEIQGYQFD